MAKLGLHVSRSERWLGVDYEPSVARSGGRARKKRLAKARLRWLKARSLLRKGIRVGRVVQQGFKATMAYGLPRLMH